MRTSESIDQLCLALAEAQAEFPIVGRGKTVKAGKYEFDYAPFEHIVAQIRPILARHGLAMVQSVGVEVVTRVIHKSGQWIESDPMPLRQADSWQELGSGVTYAQRYQMKAILGVAVRDEDDDALEAEKGAHAAQREPAPPAALEALGKCQSRSEVAKLWNSWDAQTRTVMLKQRDEHLRTLEAPADATATG